MWHSHVRWSRVGKMRYAVPLSCRILAETASVRYFSTLKSTFFRRTEGVKYEEQAIPYAHIPSNKKRSKMDRDI
jgi:hypothetical protein